jgi:hypothetical protein
MGMFAVISHKGAGKTTLARWVGAFVPGSPYETLADVFTGNLSPSPSPCAPFIPTLARGLPLIQRVPNRVDELRSRRPPVIKPRPPRKGEP